MKKLKLITLFGLFFVINYSLTAQTYSGGSGKKSDPYLISSAKDMALLATSVNNGNNYTGTYFLLTQDISNISTVIGTSNSFHGVFDGGGYELNLNLNIDVENNAHAGVFGHLSEAIIRNLSVSGTIVSSGEHSYAGGIGGYVWKSIISNCFNKADVTSSGKLSSYSGGICGFSIDDRISNCYNIGNIQSAIIYKEGDYCYSGGICGRSDKISCCFAANSKITASTNSDYFGFGRIVGLSNSSVEICYALSSILINNYTISNLSTSSIHGSNSTMSNFQSREWIESNLFFWDFENTWYIPSGKKILPVLKREPFLQFTLNPTKIIYGDLQQIPLSATSKNKIEPVVFNSSNNTIAEVNGNILRIKKAGTVTITAIQTGFYEYKSDTVTQILTIDKKELTIKADDYSMIYGDKTPIFTASYSGFVLGENQNNLTNLPVITCNANEYSNVNYYTITPSGSQSDNYSFAYKTGILSIQKRALSVIANDVSKVYGTNNPIFNFTYQGFVNGQSDNVISVKPTATTIATHLSDVGNYPITCSGGSANNYKFTSYESGILTIIKAPLTINAKNAWKSQGQPNPTFTMSYSGFVNGDDYLDLDNLPVINCMAETRSPKGLYDIVLTGGSDNNYTFTLINGTLTITAASAIENIYSKEINIYPNPVKDELHIECGDLLINGIEILDIFGKKICQLNNFKNQKNISKLPKGKYFLKIETNKGILIKKFIKE